MKRLKKIMSLLLAVIMIASVLPMTAFADANSASEFVDLPEEYYDDVQFVLDAGLMNGIGWGTSPQGIQGELFAPNDEFSRAMMVTVLYRFIGEPEVDYSYLTYEDVTTDQWYASAVAWATEYGVVNGYSATVFGPDDIITREQAFTIFHRFTATFYDTALSVPNGDYSKYSDANLVSDWASDATSWVVGAGVDIGNTSSRLTPKNEMNRIEAAIMLRGLFEYLADYDIIAGYALKVDINGSGTVTIGNRTFSADGAIMILPDSDVDIAISANDDAYISYFVEDGKEPTYTYNSEGAANYSENLVNSYEIINMDSNRTFRVYFYEEGEDEKLVNPLDRLVGTDYNTGFGDKVLDYNILVDVLGKTFADNIMKDTKNSNYSVIASPIKGIKLDGRCFGISATANMISQPWRSNITAAEFASDLSYTVPNQIKGADIGGVKADKLSLLELVDAMQVLSLRASTADATDYWNAETGIHRFLDEEQVSIDGTLQWEDDDETIPSMHTVPTDNQEYWDEMIDAIENYENTHTNPVILHLAGDGAHAVVARSITQDGDDFTIGITDPTGSSRNAITLTYDASGDDYTIGGYSGKKFTKLYYLTFDHLVGLWENKDSTVTPNRSTPQLANVSNSDGSLAGLAISNSASDTIRFSNTGILSEIEGASLVEFYTNDESTNGSGSRFLWLPEDTYTMVNTKDSTVSITISDDYATMEIIIDPGVTATFKVCGTSVTECSVQFETEADAEGFVAFSFLDGAGVEFDTLSVSGTIMAGDSIVQKEATGVSAKGFDNLTVTRKGTDGNTTMNQCNDLSGQAIVIDGMTAEITGNTTIVQDITYADPVQQLDTPVNVNFTAGIATWDAVDNASSYNVGLYSDGELVGYLKGTGDCYFDFTGYMKDTNVAYTFSVQALAASNTGYVDGEIAVSEAIYLSPAVELAAPEDVGLYQGIGTWSAVDNAVGYELTLYCDGEIIMEGIITTETTYDFNDLPQRGVYYFTIRTLGDETDYLGSYYVRSNNNLYSPTLSSIDSFTITVEQTCGGTISPGTRAVRYEGCAIFVITPILGYKVADVLVDGVSVGVRYTYTFENVIKNHTITAVYEPILKFHTITVEQANGGVIAPCSQTMLEGTTLVYAIVPNLLYKVADVQVDGVSVGAVNVYTFKDISEDHTITATFKRIF